MDTITAGPEFMRQWRRNIWLDFVERKPGSGLAFMQAIENGSAPLMILENFKYAKRPSPYLSGTIGT